MDDAEARTSECSDQVNGKEQRGAERREDYSIENKRWPTAGLKITLVVALESAQQIWTRDCLISGSWRDV